VRKILGVFFVLALTEAFAGPAPSRAAAGVSRARNGTRSAIPVVFQEAATLCSSMGAPNQVGNWWCLEGDGTMFAGSAITLSPVNSPVVTSHPVCPSGTNCTNGSDMLLNPIIGGAKQYFVTSGNITPPAGSFTTCALGWYEETNKGTSNQPTTPWVMMTDLAGGSTPWDMSTPSGNGATGLRISCEGAGGTCGINIDSNVQVYQRVLQLNCGVFTANTSTKSCTYSAGTTTCVTHAHTVAKITTTPLKWAVGVDNSIANVWKGFMRGVFMTEKALSAAEISAIGAAVTLSAPSGQTFTRATSQACCRNSDGMCADVNVDVPCIVNGVELVQDEGQNYIANSERLVGGFTTNGFNGTTTSANACDSPYGLRTADQANYAANLAADQYERSYAPASFGSFPGPRIFSFAVHGTGATPTGTLDFCADQSPTRIDCTTVPFTAGWARYSFAFTQVQAGVSLVIGNLPLYNGGTMRPAQSVCATNFQAEIGSTQTSYMSTTIVSGGISGYRGPSVCTGTSCP
jgi:hypothetical protein